MKPAKQHTKLVLILLLLISSLWLTSLLLAQTSANYDGRWYTFANGSSHTSANYALQDAIGQLAGDFSSSDNNALQSGFIQAIDAPNNTNKAIFLPLIMR